MDWSAFHFLRPLWLLALLPAVWVWWRLRQKQHPLGNWGKVIEARFLQHFQPAATPPQRWPVHGLLLLWVLATFALAGPTWVQKTVPAHKTREGTVIVLDLSLSMLAEDLKPNRIKRAIFKLTDLVKSRPELKFGLVGYAGSAHVITPIAEDNETLLNLLPALNPLIMPQFGSRPDLAMEKAEQLFQGAHIEKGHIIWVTDDLDQAEALNNFFTHHKYTLSILAIGTQKGAPIPTPDGDVLRNRQGNPIIAKLPWQRLKHFAELHHASITSLQLDNSDLPYLLPPFEVHQAAEAEQVVTQWLDFGIYLLPIIALLAAFVFRRGWVFVLLVCWLPVAPSPTYAAGHDKGLSDWRDIFRTPDQQGYRLWQQHKYTRACDRFQRPDWKGVACYRAGDYKAAERAFRQDKTARGYYNLGNALAQQHRYAEAMEAYRQALKLDPALTAAQENLNLLKQLQHTAPPKRPAPQHTPAQTPSAAAAHSAQKVPEKTQTAPKTPEKPQKQAKTPQNPNKTEAQKNASSKKRGDPPSSQPDADQAPKPVQVDKAHSALGKAAHPKMQNPLKARARSTPMDNWLQLIPDNPALYLQRKFEYQLQQQPPHREQKPW